MSIVVSLEEAQARLREIIRELAPGEELVIMENLQLVARLTAHLRKAGLRPPPGLGKGFITVASDDEGLEDFAEYMP